MEREREEGTVPAGNGDGVVRTPEAEKKRKQGILEEPSHTPQAIREEPIPRNSFCVFVHHRWIRIQNALTSFRLESIVKADLNPYALS